MKKGKLLLNWQKEPVGVYLGGNRIFVLKTQQKTFFSDKQMLGFFYQERGLSGANLEGVDLRGVDLRGVDLTGANLVNTNLRGAVLDRAVLSRAVLSRAYLRFAILQGANLQGANLEGAIYSKYTIWPTGFDKSRLSS